MKQNHVTSLSASLSNRNDVTFRFNGDDATVTESDDNTSELNRPSNIHVFSASSTLHGFSHIFALHHSSLRRFAWTVAFLTSLTLFLLQSSNRAIYYISYPHVTRIDEVSAGDLDFPSITICNLNELRFGQITKNDMFHAGKLLGFLDNNDTLIRPEYFDNMDSLEPSAIPKMKELERRIKQLSDFSGFRPNANFNMFEFYNRAGHNIQDTLLTCKYRGKTCNYTSFTESSIRMYANNGWSASDNMITSHELQSGVKFTSLSAIEQEPEAARYQDQRKQIRNGNALKEEIFERNVEKDEEPIQQEIDQTVAESIRSANTYRKVRAERNEPKPSDLVFFASNSTFHGISHIFTPSRFTLRKALWAIFFFSSLGLFLQQAYDRYSYYSQHPHVTKLDEQEAAEMSFPALTICNVNSFRLGEITTDDYFYAGSVLGLFNSDFSLKVGFRDNRTWPFVERQIRPIMRQRSDYKPTKRSFDMFEFYNRTGQSLDGLLKICRYRGKPCKKMQWRPVFTRYGKCYTFNSGKDAPLLKTLKGGIDNGLEILLDTQQDEYLPVWDESDEISVEAGFKVQIHAQTEPPFIHELGFGVSPGFQTLIATQEQRITFLPSPWGNCIEGFNKSQHYHFDNYSISACRITCETKFVVANCKCRMIHMPGDSTPYCTPEQYKLCADPALDFLVMKDVEKCVCETPCEVTRYNLETSTLQLPSTQALSYLAYKYKVSEDYVKNNYVKLNIFFEALNYETIEQKRAYEIPGLLGDIGGQMGLFIGASLLTILELFDYFYEVIKVKTWGKKLSKSKEEDVENAKRELEKKNEATRDYVVANQRCLEQQPQQQQQHHVIEDGRYLTYTTTMTRADPHHEECNSNNCRRQQQQQHQRFTQGYGVPNYKNSRDSDFRSLPPPPAQYTGVDTTPLAYENGSGAARLRRGYGTNSSAVPVSAIRAEPTRIMADAGSSHPDLYRYSVSQTPKPEDQTVPNSAVSRPQYLDKFTPDRQGYGEIGNTTSTFAPNEIHSSSGNRSRPGSSVLTTAPMITSDETVPDYSTTLSLSPIRNVSKTKDFMLSPLETDIH